MAGKLSGRSGKSRDLEVNADPNVIPFIDIMLVLLIIFMIAAPISSVDIEVAMPDARIVPSQRPPRPTWMDEATYETIPATLTLRELRYQVVEPGRRTQLLTVVTTLTDAKLYTKAEIAELYGFRWNAELKDWDSSTLKQLDIHVLWVAAGREQNMTLSTLVDPGAN